MSCPIQEQQHADGNKFFNKYFHTIDKQKRWHGIAWLACNSNNNQNIQLDWKKKNQLNWKCERNRNPIGFFLAILESMFGNFRDSEKLLAFEKIIHKT